MAVNFGNRCVPSLLARDMRQTLEFYTQKLGFVQTAYYPIESDPDWTEVRRDDVAIHFYTEPLHGTKVAPTFSGTVYFYPESVAALAEELRDKVRFEWGPEVLEYGMREFGIRDPNGYLLAFAEPAKPAEVASNESRSGTAT